MAFGIVSKGLGGNATNYIIGRFSLGGLEVDLVVGSPGLEPGVPGGGRQRNWVLRPPWGTNWVPPYPRYDVLFLTVRFQGREWRTRLYVSEKLRDGVVVIVSTFRTVAKSMKAIVGGLVERVRSFSVKVRNR